MNKNRKKMGFPAWIRPLSFYDYDSLLVEKEEGGIRFIRNIYGANEDKPEKIFETINDRYNQVTENMDCFIIPYEETVLKNIVSPLKQAKIAYCLKHEIGSIALCGMVCEMIAVFIYDLLPEDVLVKVFGDSKKKGKKVYEEWRQDERVRNFNKLSSVMPMMPEEDRQWCESLLNIAKAPKFITDLNAVRSIRRKYLHTINRNNENLETDAKKAYLATYNAFDHIFPFTPGSEPGTIGLPPYLEVYLQRKGLIREIIKE